MRNIRSWAIALSGLLFALPAITFAQEPSATEAPGGAPTPAVHGASWDVQYVDSFTRTPELGRLVSWDIHDKRLREAVEVIQKEGGLPVILNFPLVDAGLVPSTGTGGGFFAVAPKQDDEIPESKVTTRVAQVPLWAALDALVFDVDDGGRLDWRLEGGAIVLTTQEFQAEKRTLRRYDLTPFRGRGIHAGMTLRAIPDVVAGPWDDDEPGTATIGSVGNVVVVNNHPNAHRELGALWHGLSHLQADEVILEETEATKRVEAALDLPFTADFDGASLDEVAKEIERQMSIPVVVHSSERRGLTKEGEHPVKFRLKMPPRPLREVLNFLWEIQLREGLTAIPHRGRLVITSEDVYLEHWSLRIYNLRPFEEAGRTEELLEMLQEETAEEWYGNKPGMHLGTLAMMSPDVLLVRQNARSFEQVRASLSSHKYSLKENPETRRRIETRAYFVKAEDAEALQRMIAETVAPGTWGAGAPGVIRSFDVPAGKIDPFPGTYLLWDVMCCKDPPKPTPAGTEPPKAVVDRNKEARNDLIGSTNDKHTVLLIRHEYHVHRMVDDRIQQFFAVRRIEICPGRTPQYGYLVDDIEFGAADPVPPRP